MPKLNLHTACKHVYAIPQSTGYRKKP